MNTRNMTQEEISAFADGEMTDAQINAILGVLRTPHGRDAWDAYHQIGDVLRSDEMAFDMSPAFSAKMAMRLREEPTIMAPFALAKGAPQMEIIEPSIPASSTKNKRYLMRGIAAAGVTAALTLFATPQLMVATNESNSASATSMLASGLQINRFSSKVQANTKEGGEMLRDPSFDEYLVAHQRFSPSVYSTAQYVRSATFAIDSDK